MLDLLPDFSIQEEDEPDDEKPGKDAAEERS